MGWVECLVLGFTRSMNQIPPMPSVSFALLFFLSMFSSGAFFRPVIISHLSFSTLSPLDDCRIFEIVFFRSLLEVSFVRFVPFRWVCWTLLRGGVAFRRTYFGCCCRQAWVSDTLNLLIENH